MASEDQPRGIGGAEAALTELSELRSDSLDGEMTGQTSTGETWGAAGVYSVG